MNTVDSSHGVGNLHRFNKYTARPFQSSCMATVCSLVSLLAGSSHVEGQAPPILWSTNIGAKVFAVDEQTNIYAIAGNAVIKLNAMGSALETNRYCPLPGLALRDSGGNFYFTGTLPAGAPTDFGGVTLTNGPLFVAKYGSSGSLVWAKEFPVGQTFTLRAEATDFQMDADENCYVGYVWSPGGVFSARVARFDTNEGNNWTVTLQTKQFIKVMGAVRLGLPPQTNVYVVTYDSTDFPGLAGATLWKLDEAGNPTNLGALARPRDFGYLNAHTISDLGNGIYNVEGQSLVKRNTDGSVIWTSGYASGWTAGPDKFGGVHVGDGFSFSRYDSEGSLIWSLPFGVNNMILDSPGNRFLSLPNGQVIRLGSEALTPPAITASPESQTVLAGSNVLLTAAATGFTPLTYRWFFNGTPLGATGTALTISGVTAGDAGSYSAVVTNVVGTATSAPALLRVKMVEIYSGNQPLTNGPYSFAAPPLLTIRSAFPNGATFYTLDGSTPNFSSIHYTGPFMLDRSATVRANGYSADFLQSEEADPVYATLWHHLTVVSSGGGTVTLNPPGGSYADTNVVSVTALPAPGWQWLSWMGDASGTSPIVSVSMERNKTVRAIFGTTLSTTAAGNGQVDLNPVGGVYPYGSVVRLSGIPQPGNYFGFWGNAASGDQNPLYFTMTNPSPTVSSIFGSVPVGHAALTVLIKGAGQVSIAPPATLYSLGAIVSLTAVPEPGQSFLTWSGDATSSSNPLVLTLNQSLTINANFTAQPRLSVNRPELEGMTPEGLRMTLTSAPQSLWEILGSTNLSFWEPVGAVSNSYGEVQFTDPGALQLRSRFYRAVPGQ